MLSIYLMISNLFIFILFNLIISTFSTGRLNAALPPWVRRPSPQERKECCTVVATCCPKRYRTWSYCSDTVPIGPSPDQCGLLRNFTVDSNSKTSLALFCVHRHKDVTFDFFVWFWLLHDNCLRTIFDLLSVCTWNSMVHMLRFATILARSDPWKSILCGKCLMNISYGTR